MKLGHWLAFWFVIWLVISVGCAVQERRCIDVAFREGWIREDGAGRTLWRRGAVMYCRDWEYVSDE